MLNEKNDEEYYDAPTTSSIEYLQMLKNLWSKYRQSRDDEFSLENLTDDQLKEMLSSLYDRDLSDDQRYVNDFDNIKLKQIESVPLRYRKNYRVFESLKDRRKRYPIVGEEIYNKKNLRNQHMNPYENPSKINYPYSLKYVYPDLNRDIVESMKEAGSEVLGGDEKDRRNVIRILNNAINHPKYYEEEEAPYWSSDEQNSYEDGVWLPGPVYSDDWYDNPERNEKRIEGTVKHFKPHNGIHLNSKRFPVKRSPSVRVRKEVQNEKVSKELKGIFGTSTVPPKKGSEKKPTEIVKKQNQTAALTGKKKESKKVIRSADGYDKERVLPVRQNEEISNIFESDKRTIDKKSIDWSQYFGIDKRSKQNWLQNDYLKRAESHFLTPKNKRLSLDRSKSNFLNEYHQSEYEMPFDTRRFNKKGNGYGSDIGNNIDNVENKIVDIEEKIIDDALKYTGSQMEVNSEDLNKVKSKVIQHLEAAYSLEKMKNALEEFKNLIKPSGKDHGNGNNFKKTGTEARKVEAQTTGKL